jgi:aminoglycoside phosphotransferase (APT) family kinase protein
MSAKDEQLQGTFGEAIKQAKARMARIDEPRLKAFIESQPQVRGAVAMGPLSYPDGGAGSSNGIAFFTAEMDRGEGRRSYDLVLRYSPGVSLLKQKSFSDEFLTIEAVRASGGLPVPQVWWLDADGTQVGFASFVMDRVVGDAPSGPMYSAGPLAKVTPGERKALMLEAAGFHGCLRKAAIGADRVPHLVNRGVGATAIEQELSWWLKEDRLSLPAADPRLGVIEALFHWMVEYQPKAYTPNLVHGDAQIANMMFRDGHIAAVLDWELSYLGHNESDLALVIFLTETHKIIDKQVDGTPTESEYLARFEASSGTTVQHWEYFKLMNMFRVCAVVLLSRDFMPNFDSYWAFNLDYMHAAWKDARAACSRPTTRS